MSFFSEDDFKTDVDLRVACLILDKQVKLINGNEANILTPHVWLKKYLDDQGKGIERQESITRPIVELQSMSKTFSEKRMIIYLSFFCRIGSTKSNSNGQRKTQNNAENKYDFSSIEKFFLSMGFLFSSFRRGQHMRFVFNN